MNRQNDRKSMLEKILRKKENKPLDHHMEELRGAFKNLSEEDKKRLMDSDPEEVARQWEELYKLPIQQSKNLLNDLFFRRSSQKSEDRRE